MRIERSDSFSPRQRDLLAYYFTAYRFASRKQRAKLARNPRKALRRVLAEWNAEAISQQRLRDLHPEIAADLYRQSTKGTAVPLKRAPKPDSPKSLHQQGVEAEMRALLAEAGFDPEVFRRRIVTLVELEEMTPEQEAELAELSEQHKAAKRRVKQARKQAEKRERLWREVDGNEVDPDDVAEVLVRILSDPPKPKKKGTPQ